MSEPPNFRRISFFARLAQLVAKKLAREAPRGVEVSASAPYFEEGTQTGSGGTSFRASFEGRGMEQASERA